MKNSISAACLLFYLLFSAVPQVQVPMIAQALVPAQELTLVYFDGEVEILERGSRVYPYMGETISDGARLMVGADSYAEIRSGNSSLKIMKEGIYTAASLKESILKAEEWEIGRIGGLNFKNIVKKGAHNSSAVMGVRGDVIEPGEIEWVDSDRNYLYEGITLLDSGDTAGALGIFIEGLELGDGTDDDSLYYYSALCFKIQGDNRKCIEYLERISAPGMYDFFDDYVILKSSILMEGLQFIEAEKLLTSYVTHTAVKDKAQLAFHMLSFCASGRNNNEQSEQYLNRAISLDSRSEIGELAKSILGKL